MKHTALTDATPIQKSVKRSFLKYLYPLMIGLLAPFGFAPFHMPGLMIISLALLFFRLKNTSRRESFYQGFFYGLGYFGFGVSWVVVSIHDYGQLNYLISGLITLIFIMYLSLFPALFAYVFKLLEGNPKFPSPSGRRKLEKKHFSLSVLLLNKPSSALSGTFSQREMGSYGNTLLTISLFSALWCISEYLRATLFTGFPWILVGTSLIDTPIRYLSPLIGVYGLSLVCVFISALLAEAFNENTKKRTIYLIIFILIIITPNFAKNIQWTEIEKKPVSIAGVQANLSMRDKWDETLFWNLLKFYDNAIHKLLGKQLIILPESAIPLPASYLDKYLENLNTQASKAHSTLLLGILQPTNEREVNYYNSIITLGDGHGEKLKRQLVPFGEYIPNALIALNRWFNLPEPNLLPGEKEQALIKVAHHFIASLICYEIAYPSLLRDQMPQAQWIVSISDNGWFGHSLASFQQLQMAQLLSLLTGRYQVVVNNDGLSSVINSKGDILQSLPAFSSGILEGEVHPAKGNTPWIIWTEYPAFIFCFLVLACCLAILF